MHKLTEGLLSEKAFFTKYKLFSLLLGVYKHNTTAKHECLLFTGRPSEKPIIIVCKCLFCCVYKQVSTHMDTLYIDTSIFESNNFFESHRINQLYKLARKEKIKVIIPELTYDEIKNRLHVNIKSSIERFNKYRTDTRVLRNIPSIKSQFEDIDLDAILIESEKRLQETFSEAKFNVIQYPVLNIGDIFRQYFNQDFPFGSGKKKNEFPDAFALSSIEKWAIENTTKVILFSKDNDLLNYKSEHLIIHEDFDEYINDKIREDEENEAAIKRVDQFIEREPHDILLNMSEWVKDQLDDISHYYDFTNYLEIHDLEVSEVNSEIDDYEIMEFDQEYIAVQFKILVSFRVELTIDDEDYMIKDDDTKDWIFLDTTTKSYEDSKYIDMNVTFYPFGEEEQMDMFIEEINHGQKLNI